MSRTRGVGPARSLAVVLAVLLSCAGTASAADVGANDDTGKFAPDGGAAFYAEMASLGLKQTVVTVRWRPSDPLSLADRPFLDLTVAAARTAGLNVVFATYPYPPREVEAGLARPEGFGAWLQELAERYPDVRQFVVGNEPNQPAFWRPQFGRATQLSARTFGPFLAAGYDALKAVDPAITVVGVGLSPRGNDRPTARSNVSTSPVRFLAALGAWYRSSGRVLPLMDGLSFHPYPNAATDPLERGYPWPNAGFANLDRVKQAVWDAFAGTSQPTTVDGLRLYLDEVGWQVDTASETGYTGSENVPVTDEETQAEVYGELLRQASCDPDVAQVNIFGLRDDALRTGFQAGLYRVGRDGAGVRSSGPRRDRRPGLRRDRHTPVASRALRPRREGPGRARHAERDRGRPDRRRGGVRPRLPAPGCADPVERPAGAGCPLRRRRGLRLRAGRAEPVDDGPARAPAGPQTIAVRLAAETNPARSTTAVRPVR